VYQSLPENLLVDYFHFQLLTAEKFDHLEEIDKVYKVDLVNSVQEDFKKQKKF